MPGISSFPDFVLLFLRGSARRCAPKLRRQKTAAYSFDSIEGDVARARARPARFFRAYPFGALPSYNDCIMTIAVSIFICGSAKPPEPLRVRVTAAASPAARRARARLLISCLPILFFPFYFCSLASTTPQSASPPPESHAQSAKYARDVVRAHYRSHCGRVSRIYDRAPNWRYRRSLLHALRTLLHSLLRTRAPSFTYQRSCDFRCRFAHDCDARTLRSLDGTTAPHSKEA